MTAPDPIASAKHAGLRYVTDTRPGIRRRRAGSGFVYVDPENKKVRDPEVLRRIRALAIPPAWTDVWICPLAHGHIQATGRDQKGRKQYRYHAKWREVRDEVKYDHVLSFARALSAIRKRTEEDTALPGLPREKVVATVVRLLEVTLIRVGNEEYARKNKSFGLTTMRDRHVAVDGSRVTFHFRGKSGKEHTIDVQDRRLARIVARCQDLPGHELFQYVGEDGERHGIESGDVNEYLHAVTGQGFTAKDFRTWAGTVLAAQLLCDFESFQSEVEAKKNMVAAIRRVSERLGNTPTVCRKCYVHPEVFDAYIDGELVETLKQRAQEVVDAEMHLLPPEEAAVLGLLQRRLARSSRHAA